MTGAFGRRRAMRRVLLIGLWLAFIAPREANAADSPQVASAAQIQIDADEGLEWQRQNQLVVARGNAHAVRGNLDVRAQELRAMYRDQPGGKTEVYRIVADGEVRIASPGQTAYGQHGTYDIANDHLLLTGGERVRLETSGNQVTAERSLEYWPSQNRLVAKGDAVAVQNGKELHGQTITAYLAKGADGRSALSSAEAVGDVKVVTAEEIIYSDRGNYDAKTGIATVDGSVKIFRGTDRLDGCRGQIDFNSGVSKLFACDQSEPSGARVRGRIQLNSGSGK